MYNSNMEYKKNHFRQILLYFFCKGESAAKATRRLEQVYGDEALKERQCRNWFTRFRAGDFSLKDEPHTGRPNEAVDDDIIALIEADPHISIRELGEKLQVHFSTIDRHLQRLGYVKDHNSWILRKYCPDIDSTSKDLLPLKQTKSSDLKISIEYLEPLTIVNPPQKESMIQDCCLNIETFNQPITDGSGEFIKRNSLKNNKKRSVGVSKGRIIKKTSNAK